MKFLLTTYEYPEFLAWLYQRHPGLDRRPYAEQLRQRLETGFLWADFYSRNLRQLGHEAEELVPENPHLQLAWARENGLRAATHRWRLRWRRGWVPWVDRVESRAWLGAVLLAQLRAFKPDVFLVRDIGVLPAEFLREAKSHARLVVGQHASFLDPARVYEGYDLILSSLPAFVDYFRRAGARAERLRLGFEPSVLERTVERPRSINASFVGKLSEDHSSRAVFLEDLCSDADVQLWGSATRGLSAAALKRYRGPAWGIDMFQVLRDSRITINQHEAWAGPHANNLRLFEATGVGTLLLTDWKQDLHELFEPGREVVAYRSPEECRELITYYLAHDQERQAIAAAGQARTLREHTYLHRMQELLGLLRRYL